MLSMGGQRLTLSKQHNKCLRNPGGFGPLFSKEGHMNTEIDFSQIQQPAGVEVTPWEPPSRVFFGKRAENGKKELEPDSNRGTGARIAFPALLYGKVEGRITAKVANSESEKAALVKEGFKDTPAAFGYVGAPDFDSKAK